MQISVISKGYEIVEILQANFPHKPNTAYYKISLLPLKININILYCFLFGIKICQHSRYDEFSPFPSFDVDMLRIQFFRKFFLGYTENEKGELIIFDKRLKFTKKCAINEEHYERGGTNDERG